MSDPKKNVRPRVHKSTCLVGSAVFVLWFLVSVPGGDYAAGGHSSYANAHEDYESIECWFDRRRFGWPFAAYETIEFRRYTKQCSNAPWPDAFLEQQARKFSRDMVDCPHGRQGYLIRTYYRHAFQWKDLESSYFGPVWLHDGAWGLFGKAYSRFHWSGLAFTARLKAPGVAHFGVATTWKEE